MQDTIQELQEIVSTYERKFSAIAEHDFSSKPNPAKWSKKEVVGHLIDSGQNNLRRFICGQYESVPPKIKYEQDFWVIANGYQSATQHDVIQLWKLVNNRIVAILSAMPKENYTKACDFGKETPELRTLEWLAEDYVKHLKHHTNQVIPGSFDIKYPS